MVQTEFDCAVVGGGLVGATLALALGQNGIRTAVIEAVEFDASAQPSFDDRGLALAASSIRILDALGVGELSTADATPIARVHVSDEGHFGAVRLTAEALGWSELGRVIIARRLGGALLALAKTTESITWFCPARLIGLSQQSDLVSMQVAAGADKFEIQAPLMIVADGTDSRTRLALGVGVAEFDYQQSAVVTTAAPEREHNNTAFERFTRQGLVATLPLANGRCGLVIVAEQRAAQAIAAQGDEEFCNYISERFGGRLGRVSEAGQRGEYGLRRLSAKHVHGARFVLMGNAAQTVHPNAAQGLNLGFRQVAILAELLVDAYRQGIDLGEPALLSRYAQTVDDDRRRILRFTHGLGELFYNDFPLAIAARGSAMLAIDLIPALKRHVIEVLAGLAHPQPKLVQGLPL